MCVWPARCSDSPERFLSKTPPGTQVAELKQQIRVLQAVGFGAVEGEEAGAVGSLEVKLLGKLRGLEHALTMARLQEAQSAGEAADSGCLHGGSVGAVAVACAVVCMMASHLGTCYAVTLLGGRVAWSMASPRLGYLKPSQQVRT